MIVFRKLVVVGLLVGLGSCGLGCSSKYPRYDSYGSPKTCDLPDAPAENLYFRSVQTEASVKKYSGVATWAHTDFRWSKSGKWTRVARGQTPFHLCTQKALDRLNPTTTTKAKTTTTKASTVDIDRCRRAMKEVKRVLYTSDNDVFDNAFRVTLRVCGNRRTWLSVAKAEGGSIDGMLTAACMLNGNTAVCKN